MLVALLISCPVLCAAQQPNIARLEVTGHASEQAKPDQTTLRLHLSAIRLEYAETLRALDTKMRDLVDRLNNVGIESDEVKTRDFNIQKNVVYRNRTRIDSGFIASQYAELRFDYDRELLGKIISKVGLSQSGAGLQVAFGLSEKKKQALKNQLIRAAIQDARAKALIIADEAGVELVRILQVQYGTATPGTPAPVYSTSARMAEDAGPQIEPTVINLGQHIQIMWEIREPN